LSNGFSCSGHSASGRIENDVFTGRYAAIARETAILSAQHLYRLDEQRRLATLVVFAREMEVELTDAARIMFDKMMGGVKSSEPGTIRSFCAVDSFRLLLTLETLVEPLVTPKSNPCQLCSRISS
jgi:hypothetical protein